MPNLEGKQLIFIIGSPRSGTTMIREVFDQHPTANALPETSFYDRIWAARRYMGNLNKDYARKKMAWHMLFDCIDPKYPHYQNRLDTLEKNLIRLDNFSDVNVFTTLLLTLTEKDQTTIIEKTPSHIYYIHELSKKFPNAKFIYITRNPIDTILSSLARKDFSKNYKKYAAEWVHANNIALQTVRELGARVKTTQYEAIIQNPKNALKDLFDFAGLSFDETYLNVPSNSSFSNSDKKGILPQKNNGLLPPSQLKIVQSIVSKTANKLGYSIPHSGKFSPIFKYTLLLNLEKHLSVLGLRPLGSMLGMGIEKRYKKSVSVNK